MELWYAPRHSLRSCPRRNLIGSTAAERYPLASTQTPVRSRHLLSVTVAPAFFAAGCFQRSPVPPEPLLRHSLRADAIGCYSLFRADGRRIDTTYYNASPNVRLDSAVVASFDSLPGAYREMLAFDELWQPSRSTRGIQNATWSTDSLSDSLRLSFVNGFSGAQFVFLLAARSDTVHGRASESWDIGPSVTDRGQAFAVRIACPTSTNRAG